MADITRPLINYSPISDGSHRFFKILYAIVVSIITLALVLLSIMEQYDGTNLNSNTNLDSDPTPSQSYLISLNDSLSRGLSAGVSAKSNLQLLLRHNEIEDYPWNATMLTWQRTAFHFQPQRNWMNGPLYYKGWYHFFYQYNPHAAVWGDIVWGHAVSKDLINWFHLPFALVPDQWYDIKGVWTGSATILPNGEIMMLYTGWTNGSLQVQNLAYPKDLKDPLLREWTKYANNPILLPPPNIGHKDFRDPTTAWLTSNGDWRISIGSVNESTGIALIYETKDFINFKMLDNPLHGVPNTGMWECVDFFPVSTSSDVGLDTSVNGDGVKHVVKASFDDHRIDYYALGTYFEENCSWVPQTPDLDVGIGHKYDYGLFYASKSFYDVAKKRRILWGWIPESDSEYSDVKKGWASLQSIPRTLLLDRKIGNNLVQWPVDEVENLRIKKKEFNNLKLSPGSIVPLHVESATQLDIIAEFELLNDTMDTHKGEFKCETSKGSYERGALGPFGILVLTDDNQIEQSSIYFYIAKGENGSTNTFMCTDTLRSSLANDVSKQVYGSLVPILEGEKLQVRILVDHSIIESFGQGGRTCITSRVYPTQAINGAAKLFLFNNATQTTVTSSINIWQLGSAHMNEYSTER